MDPPHRRGASDEVEFIEHRRGHRVEQRSRATKGLFDEAAHLPTREAGLARGRIDRDHAADLGGVTFVATRPDDDVHDGIGHLTLAAKVGHLAKEEGLYADRQLTLAPRLIEEHDVQRVAVVGDAHLDHRLSLLRPPALHLGDLAEDRGLLADREVAEVDPLGPVDVATGIDGKEVKDRLDTHRREGRHSLFADVAQLANGDVA